MHLGIVTSHPIQYQAPLFRALAKRVDLTVYFSHQATGANQAEAGFGVSFDWDTDLTSGYRHIFLENVSRRPGITRFGGCDTPSISKKLASDTIDVLTVYGWHLKSYLQAVRAAQTFGIPIMARTDSHLDTPRPLAKRVIKAITYPVFFRQFRMFLPTGSRSAEYLRRYHVTEARIRTVPYCVDVTAFVSGAECARANRNALRTKFGVAEDEQVVLFVGKLVALKGIPTLIEALVRLSALGQAVRLVIVGSGPLAEELKAMANAHQLPITFLGFVNQSGMPEVYAAADVLALPSHSETWGLVVNEAFACGLPAVVSDRVGCAPDMIKDGLTGTVVPVGDVEGFARAIRFWINRRDQVATSHALKETTARYSPERSAAAFISAAELVLGAHRMATR